MVRLHAAGMMQIARHSSSRLPSPEAAVALRENDSFVDSVSHCLRVRMSTGTMPDAASSSGLSVCAATMMVANCAIGAGVLSFPFCVRCCGVAVGAVVIVCGAALLAGSLHIIASGSALSGGLTYQSVIRRVLPPRLAAACGEFLEVTIYIYLLGVGSAFFNVISDQLLPLLAPAHSLLTTSCDGAASDFALASCRWPLITLYACVVELPLCVIRDLSLFRYSSFFAVCAIAYLVVIVCKYAIAAEPSDWVWVNTAQPLLIFKAVPLVFFAFNCHLAYIPIFNRLHEPIRHVRSMDTVAAGAYTLCLSAYLITGIGGYIAFGSSTPGVQSTPPPPQAQPRPNCSSSSSSTQAWLALHVFRLPFPLLPFPPALASALPRLLSLLPFPPALAACSRLLSPRAPACSRLTRLSPTLRCRVQRRRRLTAPADDRLQRHHPLQPHLHRRRRKG